MYNDAKWHKFQLNFVIKKSTNNEYKKSATLTNNKKTTSNIQH